MRRYSLTTDDMNVETYVRSVFVPTPLPLPDSWDAEEQHLDAVYQLAEEERAATVAKLQAVLAQSGGTPQARSERESYNALYTSQIRAIDESQAGLCFGRIDIVPEAIDDSQGEAEATRYIGRMGLLDNGHDCRPILVDWRAPLARPYYLATTARPEGVWRRRTIHSLGRTLTSLSDEFLTHGETPTGYPDPHDTAEGVASESALLKALNAPRTGRMTDIVATIQREQDEIIRCEHRGIVVVEGGPGTGKTAVALHRAAYLLYTFRSVLERSGVLIIGPNDTFLRYINHVLPSLGETGVVLMTLGNMFPGVTARAEDSLAAQEVKGSLLMVDVLKQAIRAWQTILAEPVTIHVDGTPFSVTPRMTRRARGRARSSRRPHNRARQLFHDTLVEEIVNAYAAEIGTDPEHPDRPGTLLSHSDIADLTEDLLNSPEVQTLVAEHWPILTAEEVVERLLTDRTHAEEACSGILPAGDIDYLLRPQGEPFTVADVPLLDEAAEQLGRPPRARAATTSSDNWQQMVEDAQDALDILKASASLEFEDESDSEILAAYDIIDARRLADRHTHQSFLTTAERASQDREWAFGHVIIDEAQELSPLAWRMVMRRSPNRWMTIVGDTAQTSNPAGVEQWENALSPYVKNRWRSFTLSVNYRTTRQIMEASRGVLAEINPAARLPRSIRSSEHEVALVDRDNERWSTVLRDTVGELVALSPEEQRSCGILVSPDVMSALVTESHAISVEELVGAPVSLVQDAKGLEYDYVIVADPVGMVEASPQGLNDLFVAMTRATQALAVVHDGALPYCLSNLVE